MRLTLATVLKSTMGPFHTARGMVSLGFSSPYGNGDDGDDDASLECQRGTVDSRQ
jgi:hypothetical protein